MINDKSQVDANGGTIAIGPPAGAPGCRSPVTLPHGMRRRDAREGVATPSSGGGMGVALSIER